MNLWELKRAGPAPGKRPTKAFLRTVQNYGELQVSARYPKGKTCDLEAAYQRLLKFLKIDRVQYSPNEAASLIREEDAVQIFVNQTDSVWRSKEAAQGVHAHSDGKLYSASCYRGIKKYDSKSKSLKYMQVLYWDVGPIKSCMRCGAVMEAADLIPHEMIDGGLVDPVCKEVLDNWENPRPSLSEPITGYHSHKANWIFIPRRVKKEKSIPMGVEIEMHSLHGNSKIAAYLSAQQTIMAHPDNNYYFEWDGSLADGGFEMVTNPMTLEYHNNWWPSILKTLRANASGYNVEQAYRKNSNRGKDLSEEQEKACEDECYDYGIHITISRQGLPDAVVAKMCKFFDDAKNREFLWCVAQRARMYGGYTLGGDAEPSVKKTLVFDRKKIHGGVDRRQPVNLKGSKFIEFRMFRSTLNQVSFLKNLEFIDALIQYLSGLPGSKPDHRSFILWLQRPENSKRYPNLLIYLQHPLFFVRGAGKVKNNWSDLFMDYKLVIKDPYKEYGPLPEFVDINDAVERSMV